MISNHNDDYNHDIPSSRYFELPLQDNTINVHIKRIETSTGRVVFADTNCDLTTFDKILHTHHNRVERWDKDDDVFHITWKVQPLEFEIQTASVDYSLDDEGTIMYHSDMTPDDIYGIRESETDSDVL